MTVVAVGEVCTSSLKVRKVVLHDRIAEDEVDVEASIKERAQVNMKFKGFWKSA